MVGATSADSAIWEMVEAGGRTAQSFGLSRIYGQLYMLLYLSNEPRSLEDLAVQLGVSKASVSIACRRMESWSAVRRVWVRGDRRDFYEAQTDFRAILNGLLPSVSKKLESARIQIERSMEMLEHGRADDQRKHFLRERLAQAEQRRKKIAALLDNPLVRSVL